MQFTVGGVEINIPAEGVEWQEVKTWQLVPWLIAYVFIMWTYRAGGIRLLDAAYLVVHEAGHPLFSYTGSEILTVLGGTVMQLAVPIMLLLSFAWRGHTLGVAFCGFAFFNSLTGVAMYMGDARSKGLPLVAPGVASDEVEGHDWEYIFNWIGHNSIMHDQQLAQLTSWIAWAGMVAALAWLVWMWKNGEA